MGKVALHLSGDKDADAVLSNDSLALLIGMVLDQQVTLEKAFWAPSELERRLGGRLDAASIAAMEPEALAEIFRERPALHRYPASMAGRVQEVCRLVADEFGGKAEAVWQGVPDGAALVARLRTLPGFGEQKSKIFAALLGKQLGVQPEGWRAASKPFGEDGSFLSVADITGPDSLAKVRAHKQAMKAKAKAKATAKAKAPAKA
jgi:uncharacterized HhH-GPD family protein